MTQLSLLDAAPLARRRDPETSKQAAREAKELQAVHQRCILACLEQHGPLGADLGEHVVQVAGVDDVLRAAGLAVAPGQLVQGRLGDEDAAAPDEFWHLPEEEDPRGHAA